MNIELKNKTVALRRVTQVSDNSLLVFTGRSSTRQVVSASEDSWIRGKEGYVCIIQSGNSPLATVAGLDIHSENDVIYVSIGMATTCAPDHVVIIRNDRELRNKLGLVVEMAAYKTADQRLSGHVLGKGSGVENICLGDEVIISKTVFNSPIQEFRLDDSTPEGAIHHCVVVHKKHIPAIINDE